MKKINIIVFLLAILLFNTPIFAERYAILISAGKATTDDQFSNSEYWYDLYLAYEDLIIKQGYSHQNVIVFYGDGIDFTTTTYPRYKKELHGWTNSIVDFDNAYATMNAQFANLGNIITGNDEVLIQWVVGHGGSSTNDNYTALIQNRNTSLTEQQLNTMINQINNYSRRKILWMTCHAGCIVYGNINFNNNRSVVIPSSNWNQNSWGMNFPDTWHAEFNYVTTSALYGEDPVGTSYDADLNNDNEISMLELFTDANNSSLMSSDPQLGDGANRAPRMYIDECLELNGANTSNTEMYEAESISATNYIINSGTIANVTFAASNLNVKLLPGFKVNNGAKFHGFIGSIVFADTKNLVNNKNNDVEDVYEKNYVLKELNFNKIFANTNDFFICPNPVKDKLLIKSVNSGNDMIQYNVYNINGTLVYSKNTTERDLEIDFLNKQSGIYIIKIIDNNGMKIFKIVKD